MSAGIETPDARATPLTELLLMRQGVEYFALVLTAVLLANSVVLPGFRAWLARLDLRPRFERRRGAIGRHLYPPAGHHRLDPSGERSSGRADH